MQMYAFMYPHVHTHTHTVLSVAVGVLICQTVIVTLRALCYKSCVWAEHKTSHREAPVSRIREAPRAEIRTAPLCRICAPIIAPSQSVSILITCPHALINALLPQPQHPMV